MPEDLTNLDEVERLTKELEAMTGKQVRDAGSEMHFALGHLLQVGKTNAAESGARDAMRHWEAAMQVGK